MDSKWWEYYAVRYFVGTVVGALIVVFLNSNAGSPYCDSLPPITEARHATFLGLSLAAAIGFAFCYIASAPMLTLHTSRVHLSMVRVKANPPTYVAWLGTPTVIAIAGSLLIGRSFSMSVVGALIGAQLGLVLLVLRQPATVGDFYRDLAKARAEAAREGPNASREYITSYRHLREHGNAVAIVLLEALLACGLFAAPSPRWAFWMVVLWLVPATLAWMVGTVLERRLVSDPLG
jgi:hypothetical protein